MRTDRWDEIARIYEAVVARPPEQRASAVAALCGTDPDLRREVESLLDDTNDGPLIVDRPVAAVAAALISEPTAHLAPGTVVGPYRIVGLLGVGGMGEVYRAQDSALQRDVAIKLLPAAVAADPDRLARFKREAQLLASLNHPHIATIYGLETIDARADAGPGTGIVMELVEGPTLAERLETSGAQPGRALPVAEALAIARQIADALASAHERGIVHRDLKPANLKVREDGTVKVLDFGLAKIVEARGDEGIGTFAPAPGSHVPTVTTPAITAAGIILGTAAYMSPEQAKGKAADQRSDIWAFGCVIFEMLTGIRAFAGDDVAEVLASVLAREPDWTRLPSDLPPILTAFLKRCLAKPPRQRLAHVQDLRLALEGAFDTTVPAVNTRPRAAWRRAGLPIGAALVGGAVVAAGMFGFGRRTADAPPARVSRLQIASAGSTALSVVDTGAFMTITPDGTRLAYIGNQRTQIFVRALDALEPKIVFTRLPRDLFASPDSQWIGFVDDGLLKKVSLAGGPAIPISRLDGPTSLGATWGPDDTIIFATTNGASGLQRVSASGGPTTVLTRPDGEKGEADHAWPQWLPGGRAVLFTTIPTNGGIDASQVEVLDLQTGLRRILVHGGSDGRYVAGVRGGAGVMPGAAGYLLYATNGTLWATPFDLAGLQTVGPPVAVVRDVVTTLAGNASAVVSDDGTLVYATGPPAGDPARTLVWVDRSGTETSIAAAPRAYVQPRLSPNGQRFAVFAADQQLDLWVSDIARPALSRVTYGPGVDASPVWTPDSRRLIFSSQQNSPGNLFVQAVGGSRDVARLTDSPNRQIPTDISADGASVIFTESAAKTGDDVMRIALDETHRIDPLIRSPFIERNGIISPDGHWLAYEANDSGRLEIYIRSYPDVDNGLRQISTAGGSRPLWSPSGDELIYVSPTGGLMHVVVMRGATWDATTPSPIVKDGYYTSPGNPARTYDISRDGKRFLMIKAEGDAPTAPARHLTVVLNWVEELKRLVPAR